MKKKIDISSQKRLYAEYSLQHTSQVVSNDVTRNHFMPQFVCSFRTNENLLSECKNVLSLLNEMVYLDFIAHNCLKTSVC